MELTQNIFNRFQSEYIEILGHKKSYKLDDIINCKISLPHYTEGLNEQIIFEHDNFKCSIAENQAFDMLKKLSTLEKLPKDFEYKTNVECLDLKPVKDYLPKYDHRNLQYAQVNNGKLWASNEHECKCLYVDSSENYHVHPLRGKVLDINNPINYERVVPDKVCKINLPKGLDKLVSYNKKKYGSALRLIVSKKQIEYTIGTINNNGFEVDETASIYTCDIMNDFEGALFFACTDVNLIFKEKGQFYVNKLNGLTCEIKNGFVFTSGNELSYIDAPTAENSTILEPIEPKTETAVSKTMSECEQIDEIQAEHTQKIEACNKMIAKNNGIIKIVVENNDLYSSIYSELGKRHVVDILNDKIYLYNGFILEVIDFEEDYTTDEILSINLKVIDSNYKEVVSETIPECEQKQKNMSVGENINFVDNILKQGDIIEFNISCNIEEQKKIGIVEVHENLGKICIIDNVIYELKKLINIKLIDKSVKNIELQTVVSTPEPKQKDTSKPKAKNKSFKLSRFKQLKIKRLAMYQTQTNTLKFKLISHKRKPFCYIFVRHKIKCSFVELDCSNFARGKPRSGKYAMTPWWENYA